MSDRLQEIRSFPRCSEFGLRPRAARRRLASVASWLIFAAAVEQQLPVYGQSNRTSPPSDPVAVAESAAFRTALAGIQSSIVKIETIGGAQPLASEGGGDAARREAAGFRSADGPTTGLVWSADGWILTSSFNFVRDPTIITVTLADRRRMVAKLIARDYQSRLALLKVDASDLIAPSWARPAELRVGQWAIAAGFGLGGSEPAISVGVVSGVLRASGQAVQTDAKISPASYGGPLLNLDGKAIGVCVPIAPNEDDALAGVDWYDSGIGFAIHLDHIERRMDRLKRGEDLRRGLLGITLDLRDPVEGGGTLNKDSALPAPIAATRPAAPHGQAGGQALPPPASRPSDGLLVLNVAPAAGEAREFERGDVILDVDDVPTIRILDFRRAIAKKAAGDSVIVRFRRGDERLERTVRLRAADEFRPAASAPGSSPSSAPASSATPR